MTRLDEVWDGPLGAGAATLIAAASGPGTEEELASEGAVVAAMQGILVGERGDRDELGDHEDLGDHEVLGDARRGVARLAGRVAVAKGLAAAGVVAFGVAAAAATSGVVAAVVLPRIDDDPPAVTETTVPPTTDAPSDELVIVDPTGTGSPSVCAVIAALCPPPVDRGNDGEAAGSQGRGGRGATPPGFESSPADPSPGASNGQGQSHAAAPTTGSLPPAAGGDLPGQADERPAPLHGTPEPGPPPGRRAIPRAVGPVTPSGPGAMSSGWKPTG